MSKSTKLIISVLCVLLVLGSIVCLIIDSSEQSDPTLQATQPTTPTTTQGPSLPTEPSSQIPSTRIEYADPPADPWADHPDGIRIETVEKQNFIAHVMLIRDPSAVYLATSGNTFSLEQEGTRLLHQLRTEGAIAGINAGAFNDDGSAGTHVGSVPIGMVVSEGNILWDDGRSYQGFVGMTEDHKLFVSDKIDRATVEQMKIRDGCCFGPVLIKAGEINPNINYSLDFINSRTAIGQRADGTVIFVCIDGRQVGSIGANYGELQSLMVELGAYNACTLDGGASTVMAYRDTYGLYGKAGNVVAVNSYSLFQANPRRMPTFFMVRPAKEG